MTHEKDTRLTAAADHWERKFREAQAEIARVKQVCNELDAMRAAAKAEGVGIGWDAAAREAGLVPWAEMHPDDREALCVRPDAPDFALCGEVHGEDEPCSTPDRHPATEPCVFNDVGLCIRKSHWSPCPPRFRPARPEGEA